MSFADDLCPHCGQEIHIPCVVENCENAGVIKVLSNFRYGIKLTILFCEECKIKLQRLAR